MATQAATNTTDPVVYTIWLVPNVWAIQARKKDFRDGGHIWQTVYCTVAYQVKCNNGSCCPAFVSRKQAKRYIAVRK